ncbi:hypothetical protein V1520DRAFT_331247 [Lipomyces starkeyi]|uniref:Uncharacterized protein n=1 Tax=Lipomyces starkeyi NRRL Y-11557 TaxID=675824 RepID=A0A1E3Q7E5_LIPST|nr:hypothetical protein LIPSTDRAFT_110768 [Lipomyces starkeyi NRRL Y-11557]
MKLHNGLAASHEIAPILFTSLAVSKLPSYRTDSLTVKLTHVHKHQIAIAQMTKGNRRFLTRSDRGVPGFLTLMASTASFKEDSLLPLAISTCSASETTTICFSRSLIDDDSLMLEFIQPNARKRRERIRLMLFDFLKRSYIPRQSAVPRKESQPCVGNSYRVPKFGAFFRSFGRASTWSSGKRKSPDWRDHNIRTRRSAKPFFTRRRRRSPSSVLPITEPTELSAEDVPVATRPTSTRLPSASSTTEKARESPLPTMFSSSDMVPDKIQASSPCCVVNDNQDTTASTNTVKDVRFHPTRAQAKPYTISRVLCATARSPSSSAAGINELGPIPSPSTMTDQTNENTVDTGNSPPELAPGSEVSPAKISTGRIVEGVVFCAMPNLPNTFLKSHTNSGAASIKFMSVNHLRASSPEIDKFGREKEFEFSSGEAISREQRSLATKGEPVPDRYKSFCRETTEYDFPQSQFSPETHSTPVSSGSIRFFEEEVSPTVVSETNPGPQQLYNLVRQAISIADVSLTSDTPEHCITNDCENDTENDDTGNSMFRNSSLRSSIFSGLDPNTVDLRTLIREDKKFGDCDHGEAVKCAKVGDDTYGVTRRITTGRRVSESLEIVGPPEWRIPQSHKHPEPRQREILTSLFQPLDLHAQEDDVFIAFEDISLSSQTEIEKDDNCVATIAQNGNWGSSRASAYFKERVCNMLSPFTRAKNRVSLSTYNEPASPLDLPEDDLDEMLPYRVINQIRRDISQSTIFMTEHDHITPGAICTRCTEESRYFETVKINFQASMRKLRKENPSKGLAFTQEDMDNVAFLARSEAQLDILRLSEATDPGRLL